MTKPFDASLKQIIDAHYPEWVSFLCEALGLPPDTKAIPRDADLSTISPQADNLFDVLTGEKGILHLELVARWALDDLPKFQLYNSIAWYRQKDKGPVRTILLLLRTETEPKSNPLTGFYTITDEAGVYLQLRYTVIRVWNLQCDQLLALPPGLLPLALLTNDARGRLPELIEKIDHRLEQEKVTKTDHEELLLACNILLGLRYDMDDINPLFRRFLDMEESSTYQGILNKGREKGMEKGLQEGELRTLRAVIFELGEGRLRALSTEYREKLASTVDRDLLHKLVLRVPSTPSWTVLFSESP